ncbi:MAG: alpha-D-ribose 1-methylphosphonate 5-triphosphate diphosphatase [Coriobacteriia bacterium]|nr:alpha-D-ribose 1-methylphosphonate 5-triphosphate diphosphatase [Coriobacteriia bacterium]
MYRITNGIIILPDRLLENHDILVDGNRISAIVPSDEVIDDLNRGVIDAHGGYISAGFIDIHSDYIELVASPRPSIVMDLPTALFEAERELMIHGITTMFHSLSLYKESFVDIKAIRKFENVEKLISLIHDIKQNEHQASHLIRHRLHARIEIDNVKLSDKVEELINEDKVDLISFMDHTPGQGQYRDFEVYKEVIRSYEGEVSEEEVTRRIDEELNKTKMSFEEIERLARLASSKGIAIASHDDDSAEKLDIMKDLGATISEFPIDLPVAQEAIARGMQTVVGAPNVLLGKSHAGNLSACDAVDNEVASILCSDYYPTAMMHAIFMLHAQHDLELYEAFNLVTINPAKAAKIDHELGSLEVGKKADILIIRTIREKEKSFPVITAVMVDGRVVSRAWYPSLPSQSARFATDASESR